MTLRNPHNFFVKAVPDPTDGIEMTSSTRGGEPVITSVAGLATAIGSRQASYQAVPYAGTITLDPTAGAVVQVGALTGNLTIAAPTSPQNGDRLTIILTQDATGGRTVTWDAAFVSPPVVNTAPNAATSAQFVYNGGMWRDPAPRPGAQSLLQISGAVNVLSYARGFPVGDGNSYPLSSMFGTLAEAQAVFPHAIALSDELAWAAIQAAFNTTGDVVVPSSGIYRCNRPLVIATTTKREITGYGATISHVDPTLTTSAIHLLGATDVALSGFAVDGNKSTMGVTEIKHGVRLETVQRVVLSDLTLYNNKGDGMFLDDDPGLVNGANFDITAYNCDCRGNYRQGMSIIDATRSYFFRCTFRDTAGTSPQSGVDIEPNYTTSVISEVEFHGCDFRGNAGAGLLLAFKPGATSQRGVRVFGGTLAANTQSGLAVTRGDGVELHGVSIDGNLAEGVRMLDGDCFDLNIQGGKIVNNGKEGFRAAPYTAAGVLRNITLRGVLVRGNGTLAVGTRPGVYASNASAGTFDGFSMVDCRSGDLDNPTVQSRGVKTGTGVTRVRVEGNDLRGNSAAAELSDDVATRVVRGNVGYVTESSGMKTTTPGAVSTVTIAHGLSTTPTRYTVLSANVNAASAPAYYVVADGTNLTLTFSSALSAATSYIWTWQAG